MYLIIYKLCSLVASIRFQRPDLLINNKSYNNNGESNNIYECGMDDYHFVEECDPIPPNPPYGFFPCMLSFIFFIINYY